MWNIKISNIFFFSFSRLTWNLEIDFWLEEPKSSLITTSKTYPTVEKHLNDCAYSLNSLVIFDY
jgi:hypothetical protein